MLQRTKISLLRNKSSFYEKLMIDKIRRIVRYKGYSFIILCEQEHLFQRHENFG